MATEAVGVATKIGHLIRQSLWRQYLSPEIFWLISSLTRDYNRMYALGHLNLYGVLLSSQEDHSHLMLNVLLIDDDEKLAPLLKEYCQQFDISIHSEVLPSLGLSQLKDNNFDAVILDVMLPEMDGFEVCRNIRSYERNPRHHANRAR